MILYILYIETLKGVYIIQLKSNVIESLHYEIHQNHHNEACKV